MFPVPSANNQAQTMRIKITEVNMPQRHIAGIDAYGKSYQPLLDFIDPLVAIPAIGEMWIIARRGNDWVLHSRSETGLEHTSLDVLVAGDRRLEASGVLYLNGVVIINGITFQSILDRLAALEAIVNP